MPALLRVTFCLLALTLCFNFAVADEEKPDNEKIDESELKIPDGYKRQISYIRRKWDSDREEELATVKVCVRLLKESVPNDEDAKEEFIETFEDFKERVSDEALVDALKEKRITRNTIWDNLQTRRQAALAAIEDLEYTEKDGNKKQPEVDAACAPLFKLWREPVVYCVDAHELDLSSCGPIDELVETLGSIEESVAIWREGIEDSKTYMIQRGTEWLDVRPRIHKAQRDFLKKNREVEIEGLTDEDREHVRVLNDYRMMLGRSVLLLQEQLCTAAQKHSKWMEKNQDLGHDSPGAPEGDTTRERVEHTGFRAGAYENVTIADDADAAVWRMYEAAEHHRNMVKKKHIAIGIGHCKKYWTQLFSHRDS